MLNILFFSLVNFLPVYAEGSELDFTDIADPALILNMHIKNQEYPSRKVTIVLEVKASFDSNKVSVDWQYPAGNLSIVGKLRDVINVYDGQTTILEKEFIPKESSIVKSDGDRSVQISTRVEGFVADRRFLSVTTFTSQFNGQMEVIPQFSSYNLRKYTDKTLTFAFWSILIISIILLIRFGVMKLMAYVNSDDSE